MIKFITYLKATRAELANVKWPTQRQAMIYSALVIGISAFAAVLLGAFDYLFSTGLNFLINN